MVLRIPQRGTQRTSAVHPLARFASGACSPSSLILVLKFVN
jgi:hypothetical protein